MRLLVTLKQLRVTNNDTDSYVTITFETHDAQVINSLNNMHHKVLVLEVSEDAN